MEYEIVEIDALARIISLGKYNEQCSFLITLWMISKLNESKLSFKDYDLILIKLDHFGTYPAVGVVHKDGVFRDKESEVINLCDSFLKENSMMAFLSFLVEKSDYVEDEWSYYKSPNWVSRYPQ